MIGYVRGYSICKVSRKCLKREEYLSELKEHFKNISDTIEQALTDDDIIFGLKKNKVLKVVYIFRKNKEENSLIFLKDYKTKKVDNITTEKFEQALVEEFKEMVALEDVAKVDFKNYEIVPRSIKGFSGSAFALFLGLGLIYGIFLII